MADIPEKISPLSELAVAHVPDGGPISVELTERLPGSLVQVQAWPDTVDRIEKLVEAIRIDGAVMPTGPGRWLVEDEAVGLEEKLRKKIAAKAGAVTGLTHARVVISIEGEKATWVLASGIAIDFDVTVFPIGETRVTHYHEIGVTIHRIGEDAFDLYVFTSLARSFWQWIEKASAEVGYSVV